MCDVCVLVLLQVVASSTHPTSIVILLDVNCEKENIHGVKYCYIVIVSINSIAGGGSNFWPLHYIVIVLNMHFCFFFFFFVFFVFFTAAGVILTADHFTFTVKGNNVYVYTFS